MPTKLSALQVNLADPRSIEKRVPEIEEIVAAKRRDAAEAQEDFETWNALLGKLRFLAGLVIRFEEGSADAPSLTAIEEVVRIVEEEDRPIMAIGVGEALSAKGHEVESPRAVEAVLLAAVAAGRLQELGPQIFAPLSLDRGLMEAIPAMLAPEAHLGLDGPSPQSKAEAAIRVLASEPNRPWTTPEVGRVAIDRGWMPDSDNDLASLASTLSRLVAEGKIFRPQRGQYQLAPPAEEAS